MVHVQGTVSMELEDAIAVSLQGGPREMATAADSSMHPQEDAKPRVIIHMDLSKIFILF